MKNESVFVTHSQNIWMFPTIPFSVATHWLRIIFRMVHSYINRYLLAKLLSFMQIMWKHNIYILLLRKTLDILNLVSLF
jgi:hypothetical protein